MSSVLDLTRLPLPAVVQVDDVETVIAAIKADVLVAAPELADVLDLESEPVTKLIEVFAYWATLFQARVNDAARASFIATATGADLDNLVAIYGVTRLTVTPADPGAIPPVAAMMETDGELRRRALLAIEAMSVAGPRGAWAYHALTADPDVKDVGVYGPDDAGAGVDPGAVRIVVLSRTGDGTPSPALIDAVEAVVTDETIRPLGVLPLVEAATVLTYTVEAEIAFLPGPGSAPALAEIEAEVQAVVDAAHRVGGAVRLSALFAALHRRDVVASVTLTQPAADILPAPGEAPYCTAISITEAV